MGTIWGRCVASTSPGHQPDRRLSGFEAAGLAAAGLAPYDVVVPALVAAWLDWAEARLEGAPSERRAEAEAAVALIDGLLLFRQLMGADAADRAAETVITTEG